MTSNEVSTLEETPSGGIGGGEPPTGASPRRLGLVLAVLVAVAVAATAATIRTRLTPVLAGAVLNPPVAAYAFQLPDQDGHVVSLGDLRGKVVVLTFLYTHCPDVCPLVADALHAVRGRLGSAASGAAFVAVSVDPAGDSRESVRRFLAVHRVQGELRYLGGTFAQLRPVWAHYYVGSDAKAVNPAAAAAATRTSSEVDHTAIVYLIDKAGKLVLFLPGNFDPNDLAVDIHALMTR